KMQDYYQHDQLSAFLEQYQGKMQRVCFQYLPAKEGKGAGLSFHLTAAEKKDISLSLQHPLNKAALNKIKQIIKTN
ncbi:MAG: hypothetical protein ACOVQE_10830, partial [Chitinophagaceae bacterium]